MQSRFIPTSWEYSSFEAMGIIAGDALYALARQVTDVTYRRLGNWADAMERGERQGSAGSLDGP